MQNVSESMVVPKVDRSFSRPTTDTWIQLFSARRFLLVGLAWVGVVWSDNRVGLLEVGDLRVAEYHLQSVLLRVPGDIHFISVAQLIVD